MKCASSFAFGACILCVAACSSAVESSADAPSLAVRAEAAPTEAASASSGVPSDASSPQAVVEAQLQAYNARDIDAFMATMHPQVELFAIGDPQPRAAGHDAVRTVYADLFERSPGLHSELVHRAVLGARVVDHERITGRQGGEVLELVMVYEVEDGAIRRAWSIR